MSALLPVYDRDLVIVSGRGARLTDADGKTYLDFAAGIGVNGLGYGDRKVTAAIRKQAGKLVHASNLYYSEPVRALADRLAALAPLAVARVKGNVSLAEGADFGAVLRQEAEGMITLAATEDFKEGLAAFGERRPPLFRGT